MTYFEANNIENRMVIDSEWPQDKYVEPNEWDLYDDDDFFEEDLIDDFD